MFYFLLSASARKFHHASPASNGKYFFYNSKGGSCHQQFRTDSTNKIATLEHLHPIIRKLFTKNIPNALLGGRLPYFITAWENITQDQEILSIVKGYEISFVSLTSQEKIPNLSKEQFSLLEQEGLEMLEKGAIQK